MPKKEVERFLTCSIRVPEKLMEAAQKKAEADPLKSACNGKRSSLITELLKDYVGRKEGKL